MWVLGRWRRLISWCKTVVRWVLNGSPPVFTKTLAWGSHRPWIPSTLPPPRLSLNQKCLAWTWSPFLLSFFVCFSPPLSFSPSYLAEHHHQISFDLQDRKTQWTLHLHRFSGSHDLWCPGHFCGMVLVQMHEIPWGSNDLDNSQHTTFTHRGSHQEHWEWAPTDGMSDSLSTCVGRLLWLTLFAKCHKKPRYLCSPSSK